MNIERHHANQRMSQLVCHGPTAYLAGQVAPTAQDIGLALSLRQQVGMAA